MARIVVKCPICSANLSIDNKKKKYRCSFCHNRLKISESEIVVPPEFSDEIHGKGFNNHYFLGYFIIFFGFLGIDFFIKKRYKKGIIAILIFWTGVSLIQAVFRAMEVLSLEDSEINNYYKELK